MVHWQNLILLQNYFLEYFSGVEAVKKIDWEAWFYSTGMPPFKVCVCSFLLVLCISFPLLLQPIISLSFIIYIFLFLNKSHRCYHDIVLARVWRQPGEGVPRSGHQVASVGPRDINDFYATRKLWKTKSLPTSLVPVCSSEFLLSLSNMVEWLTAT